MKAAAFLAFLGRRALFMAQGGVCAICGQQLPQRDNYRLCTIDHVWPKSMITAKNKTQGNAALVHHACNGQKGNRRPTGCEILFLFATNRALGMAEIATAQWDGPVAPEKIAWRTWRGAA